MTTLKILHTSDWHLGKRLLQHSRLEEQELFLEWLLGQIIFQQVDFLIVAGDIFDSVNPPAKAVSAYYHFLNELTQKTSCQVLIIAGNHDSGAHLEAPREILKNHHVHVWGTLAEEPEEHWVQLSSLNDPSKYIQFVALPFFRTHELLTWKKKLLPEQEENELLPLINKFLQSVPRVHGRPTILIAHHLFGEYQLAGSEHLVSLSGLSSIPLSELKQFEYVALGHIHNAQTLSTKNPHAQYCGTPIPLKFSELSERKVFSLEFEDEQLTKVEPVPVPRFRCLKKLVLSKSNYKEKLSQLSVDQGDLYPWLEVIFKHDGPLGDYAKKIRDLVDTLPFELVSLRWSALQNPEAQKQELARPFDLDPKELFVHFYQYKYGVDQNPPKQLMDDFEHILAESLPEQQMQELENEEQQEFLQ